MKKFTNILLIITAIIAVSLSAFVAVTVISQENNLATITQQITTTKTVATTQTTTATTEEITTTTKSATTLLTTEPAIDFNNISIIDLFPLSLASGQQGIKHCQGMTIDKKNGFIYYSYTTFLVKCDMDGNVIGTVVDLKDHLGDIAFNENDGKVYGTIYSYPKKALYIIIIDVNKINRKDIPATDSDVVRTVFINEAWKDFTYDLNGNGKQDGNSGKNPDHRYGCNGIDGIAFGPAMSGKKTNNKLLTVAYVIYENTERKDNDYQVFLQYDVSGWWDNYGKPMPTGKVHKSGPESYNGKYFLYTGMTYGGVQTMVYYDELNLWLLNCYPGTKSDFQNYTLFVIDGDVKPKKEYLKGQPKKDKQYVLSLYQDGNYDKSTDTYGWFSPYGSKGMDYLGDGLFYVIHPYKTWTGSQMAVAYLSVWKPDNKNPFILAAGVSNDYTISKKKRIETTAPPTTAKSTTAKSDETKSAGGILNGIIDMLT